MNGLDFCKGIQIGYQVGYNKREAEIIRCRDCRYGEKIADNIYTCDYLVLPCTAKSADSFCSWAERKDIDE